MKSNSAQIPLLRTKLHRPPVPRDYVHRPRLTARLEDGRNHPLVLVSAPAGYGKSTLVGHWLDSVVNYTLTLPPDVPAATFWSMTVYDVATRCITVNETKQANRSSRMDLLENPGGSVTLYIGPDRPGGDKAKNWIQTLPGKGWFPYFRFYAPKKAFLDKTWILPDIEKAI